MKKIKPFQVNDEEILKILALDANLNQTSYPHLQKQIIPVLEGYKDYMKNHGNPWLVNTPKLTKPLTVALIKHYKKPPNAINYIEKIRQSSPEVCPMCGGFHPTTIDHYLPKTNFPLWSIFSKNLIPACNCNINRGEAIKGLKKSQARILHPYFDDFLCDRLVTLKITHTKNFKRIEASVVCVDTNHEHVESIKYHIINVLKKINIDIWIRGQLTKLMEFPANVVKQLPRKRAVDMVKLLEALEDCLESYDGECGTPNNWNSILIHGLLNATEIHDWLIKTHNAAIQRI